MPPRRLLQRKPWTIWKLRITFASRFSGSPAPAPFFPISMILETFVFLAQTPAPQVRPPDAGMNMMVWMMFAFVLIYFLTIRPQQKKQKQLAAQIAATKTGDKVITTAGIHGMISNVKETTFILKIADNVKIEVEKSAVASIIKPAAADALAADAKA
jgi:preprotein translocase subunit YajC